MTWNFDLKGLALEFMKHGPRKAAETAAAGVVVLAATELEERLRKIKEEPLVLVRLCTNQITRKGNRRSASKNPVPDVARPYPKNSQPVFDKSKAIDAEIIEG